MADAGVKPWPPVAVIPPSFPPQCNNDIRSTHNKKFRLSEILPHKPAPNAPQPSSPAYTRVLQDGRQYAMSPMRPAKKRVSMDTDQPQEYYRRKRGKTMPAGYRWCRKLSGRNLKTRMSRGRGSCQRYRQLCPRKAIAVRDQGMQIAPQKRPD